MGTAEGTARDLADIAMSKGFAPQVATLDSHAGNLPREGAVLIVTASYNGHPPDNAKQFVDWLDQASADEVKGVRYSVFGCGDKNWATTYQKCLLLSMKRLPLKGQKTSLTAVKQMQATTLKAHMKNGVNICGVT